MTDKIKFDENIILSLKNNIDLTLNQIINGVTDFYAQKIDVIHKNHQFELEQLKSQYRKELQKIENDAATFKNFGMIRQLDKEKQELTNMLEITRRQLDLATRKNDSTHENHADINNIDIQTHEIKTKLEPEHHLTINNINTQQSTHEIKTKLDHESLKPLKFKNNPKQFYISTILDEQQHGFPYYDENYQLCGHKTLNGKYKIIQ